MKRKPLVLSGLVLTTSLFCLLTPVAPDLLFDHLRNVVRAASRTPSAKEDFDIRAGLQRTLNDPADAAINIQLAPPEASQRAQRRSEMPYVLRRAR